MTEYFKLLYAFVDHVRDLESPVHVRPALVRSASKNRRQHHEDVSPLRHEDLNENSAKRISSLAVY